MRDLLAKNRAVFGRGGRGDGFGKGVIDQEDGLLDAVGALFGFVFASNDGELVHDVDTAWRSLGKARVRIVKREMGILLVL